MQTEQQTSVSGIINLHKPVWESSAQYVYRLRRVFHIRKVGHAGSLDPFAEGVLIGCVGKATRLVEQLMGLPKTYRTTLRLGVTNETFDTERPFVELAGVTPPSLAEIQQVLAFFVGDIEQSPPAFSAIKAGGQPSYQRARRGKAVDHAARTIQIYELELEEYAWPLLRLRLRCGRGTYIRALARDVGAALGCGACCETLVRTAVGPFRIEDSVNLFTTSPQQTNEALLSEALALAMLTQA